MKAQVLSTKAVERTIMLEESSKVLMDTARALISESARRKESAIQNLSKSRQKIRPLPESERAAA